MSVETVYIVQSFQPGRGARLKADTPTAFKTEQQARRTADRLATTKAGVIVLANRGDPETMMSNLTSFSNRDGCRPSLTYEIDGSRLIACSPF
jgi:hypothetical protein